MSTSHSCDRREFLVRSSAIGAGLSLPAGLLNERPAQKAKEQDEKVSPPEDLMREHGVLNRILLIYDEHIRRLDAKQDFDPKILADSAGVIRRFVEDYHEKLEEDYLFPRFRKAGKLVDLVDTLLQQHQAGRKLTEQIQQLAVAGTLKDEGRKRELEDRLRAFNRMYRPHEAREDTVLFPAFHGIVSEHEFGALGEQFEKKEDELFGDEGFFKVVDQVAELEKKLGIYELAQFTPKE
ncbi:MAG TPA: hemerythrin domain-containing protein [Terriglobales bacterium]|nr:hemerythrin domain-containing protein [Terriglobales bacterium]